MANIIFSAHGDTNFYQGVQCQKAAAAFARGVPTLYGHMDNFAGVHCLMRAYFSCRLPTEHVRVEVTYGEEGNHPSGSFAGAKDVMETMNFGRDVAVVLDVTGAPTPCHLVIEKCRHEYMQKMVEHALGKPLRIDGVANPDLSDEETKQLNELVQVTKPYPESDLEECCRSFGTRFTYELFHECQDPQCNQDEVDAYQQITPFHFFLGIPTFGGIDGAMRSNGDYNAGPVFCRLADLQAIECAIVSLANAFTSTYRGVIADSLAEAMAQSKKQPISLRSLLGQLLPTDVDDTDDWAAVRAEPPLASKYRSLLWAVDAGVAEWPLLYELYTANLDKFSHSTPIFFLSHPGFPTQELVKIYDNFLNRKFRLSDIVPGVPLVVKEVIPLRWSPEKKVVPTTSASSSASLSSSAAIARSWEAVFLRCRAVGTNNNDDDDDEDHSDFYVFHFMGFEAADFMERVLRPYQLRVGTASWSAPLKGDASEAKQDDDNVVARVMQSAMLPPSSQSVESRPVLPLRRWLLPNSQLESLKESYLQAVPSSAVAYECSFGTSDRLVLCEFRDELSK